MHNVKTRISIAVVAGAANREMPEKCSGIFGERDICGKGGIGAGVTQVA